jgi:hypothetical protein
MTYSCMQSFRQSIWSLAYIYILFSCTVEARIAHNLFRIPSDRKIAQFHFQRNLHFVAISRRLAAERYPAVLLNAGLGLLLDLCVAM